MIFQFILHVLLITPQISAAPLNNSVLTLPSADIAANPSPFKPIYHNPPTHLLINPTLALSIFWTILPNSTESWEIRNSLRYLRRELKTQGDPEDGIYWDHVSYRSVVVDLKPVGGSIEGIIERKDFEIVLDRVMAWMLVRGYVWFGGLLDTEGLGFGRVEFGILPRGLKG